MFCCCAQDSGDIISMCYFINLLFASKDCAGCLSASTGVQFQLKSAGKTEQQRMKRWVWKAVKSRMNERSKPLYGDSLWVTLVENHVARRGEAWFDKWKMSQKRT